jgi:outer membrane immunogenic protein
MTRLILAAIALLSLGSFARATDLPMKAAPPRALAMATGWDGFHAGLSLGARWADVTGTTISFGGGAPPFPSLAVQNYDSATFRVGGYFGYDWMLNPRWLVGLEGDFAWGNGSKHVDALQGIATNNGNFSEFKHTWDAGIRGRVGYLMDPTWLIYLTGGISWLHVEATENCSANTCGPGVVGGGQAFLQVNSTTRTGWTLGGGLEKMLPGRWMVRGEYRYADYGTWRTTFGPVTPVVVVKDFDIATHTALLGIAKKF